MGGTNSKPAPRSYYLHIIHLLCVFPHIFLIQPCLYFRATIHVNIQDDNDNYPQFSEKTYTVTVDEDISVNDNPVIARIK